MIRNWVDIWNSLVVIAGEVFSLLLQRSSLPFGYSEGIVELRFVSLVYRYSL